MLNPFKWNGYSSLEILTNSKNAKGSFSVCYALKLYNPTDFHGILHSHFKGTEKDKGYFSSLQG